MTNNWNVSTEQTNRLTLANKQGKISGRSIWKASLPHPLLSPLQKQACKQSSFWTFAPVLKLPVTHNVWMWLALTVKDQKCCPTQSVIHPSIHPSLHPSNKWSPSQLPIFRPPGQIFTLSNILQELWIFGDLWTKNKSEWRCIAQGWDERRRPVWSWMWMWMKKCLQGDISLHPASWNKCRGMNFAQWGQNKTNC